MLSRTILMLILLFAITNRNTMNLSEIRTNYIKHKLDEQETGEEPLPFFLKWLSEAINAQVIEPTAMTLATADSSGHPSSRIVLLKGIENGEFRFFTNYDSRKGKEISDNPSGCLLFFWKELERQVRVEGNINKISTEESDAYFSTRPIESRVGAIVSPQSRIIENREYLDNLYALKILELDSEEKLKRPSHWGGYGLIPERIEFWQGRESRLHDRIQFRLDNKSWIRERLAP